MIWHFLMGWQVWLKFNVLNTYFFFFSNPCYYKKYYFNLLCNEYEIFQIKCILILFHIVHCLYGILNNNTYLCVMYVGELLTMCNELVCYLLCVCVCDSLLCPFICMNGVTPRSDVVAVLAGIFALWGQILRWNISVEASIVWEWFLEFSPGSNEQRHKPKTF